MMNSDDLPEFVCFGILKTNKVRQDLKPDLEAWLSSYAERDILLRCDADMPL